MLHGHNGMENADQMLRANEVQPFAFTVHTHNILAFKAFKSGVWISLKSYMLKERRDAHTSAVHLGCRDESQYFKLGTILPMRLDSGNLLFNPLCKHFPVCDEIDKLDQ